MKALGYVKKVTVGILLFIFLSFTLLMTVMLLSANDYGITEFGDTTLVIVKDDFSSDNYEKGDLVFVEKTRVENIKVGDEVFTYKLERNNQITINLGSVEEVFEKERAIAFKNGATYAEELIIGKSDKIYKGWGSFLSVVHSKWGFLFIILVPNFLIFIYVLAALFAEIKYGKVKN